MPKKAQPKKPLFHEKVIKTRDHFDSQETVLQLYKDPKEYFTLKEVNAFNKSFQKKVKDSKRDMRYMIKVMAPDGMKTLKGYYSGFQDLKDEDDYYEGKVKDATKFTNEFSQIVVYVLETKNNVKKDAIFKN